MFHGKWGVVTGVANKRSIAWAVAKKLYSEGANLILTYQSERFEKNLRELVESLPKREGQEIVRLTCDVTKEEEIQHLFQKAKEKTDHLVFFFHSIAYAPREALTGRFLDTSWEAYSQSLQISSYSLIAFVRALEELFKEGSSIVTMTYLGAERAVPGYNVMGVAKAALESSVRYLAYELGERGVRVNAISAGPVRTLAAAGIPGFSKMYQNFQEKNYFKKPLLAEQVAEVAFFLFIPASQAITGEVLYADFGYRTLGI